MSMNLQNFSVRALFQLKRPTAFLVLLLLPLPFASSLHVVCKSPKNVSFYNICERSELLSLRSFEFMRLFVFVLDLPISPHSTADFYQISSLFVNKTLTALILEKKKSNVIKNEIFLASFPNTM